MPQGNLNQIDYIHKPVPSKLERDRQLKRSSTIVLTSGPSSPGKVVLISLNITSEGQRHPHLVLGRSCRVLPAYEARGPRPPFYFVSSALASPSGRATPMGRAPSGMKRPYKTGSTSVTDSPTGTEY